MKTKILKVKITFLEPVLGTWPSNQNVARDFIASKSRMLPRSRTRWPLWARMPWQIRA